MTRVRDALKAELTKRKTAPYTKLYGFQDQPAKFVTEVLFGHYWSRQKEIAEALHTERRVAVPSCHDVGKSFVAATLGCHWLSCYPPGEAFLVTLAPTSHQVKGILWREMNRLHRKANLPGYLTQTEWKTAAGELIGFGRSPKDEDGTAIQGIHQKYVLVIIDEACGVSKTLFDAADTMIANKHSAILAIGNPDDPTSEFAQVCKPGSGWKVIPISAFDSPNFTGEDVPEYLKALLITPEWVEGRKKKWGVASPIYKAKVLGVFTDQAKDGLIPLSTITEALTRELPADDSENELGLDVARYGHNFTVLYHRRGPKTRLVNKFQGRDLMQVVGAAVQAIEQTGATRIKIDDSGLGGGVTDRLKEMKRDGYEAGGVKFEAGDSPLTRVTIVPVNSGAAPTIVGDEPKAPKEEKFRNTERYKNLRAQMNWQMREIFMTGRIDLTEKSDLDPNYDDLAAQAGAMKYLMTSQGEIAIEKKEDMEKRGVDSPDDWDALVLCHAKNITDPYLDFYAQIGRGS